MIPSRQASTNRTATVSGAGRMNGGRPLTTTTAFQTRTKTANAASTDSDAARVTMRAPSRRRSRRRGHGAGLRGFVVLEVGPDPMRGAAGRRIVERGDGPRPRQVDRDVGHDPRRARRQHDHPVGDQDRLGDAVGHDHDGRRGPLPEPQQLQVESLAGQGVERAERFVEQQDLGLQGEGSRQRHALPRPAGQLGRPGRR